MDTLTQILLCLATAAIGWTFSKLKTNREKKDGDSSLVNRTVSDSLETIEKLNSNYNRLVLELAEEKSKNLKLLDEKNRLLQKIQYLETELKNKKS
jgi:hypothetical protein